MNRIISIIGLGYTGLSVAVSFGSKMSVLGFDINLQRLDELKDCFDRNNNFTKEELANTKITYISDPKKLRKANFHIISVPTPIDDSNKPDFSPLISASEIIGKQLKKDDIVVYESTVYPGATEEVCLPVLEKSSGLISGQDFFIGYSPERINPGDRNHRFDNTIKIVSGQDEKTLEIVAETYALVVKSGVYRVSNIKTAEAAKVIENVQRDLNISLINELSFIMHRLGINTLEVLRAAETKWNFLPFRPGLVGGHCIGVDPYYLTYKAEKMGYYPQLVLAGRRVNESVPKYIAGQTIKKLIQADVPIKGAKIAILGITFKENCPDLRNSKVINLIKELNSYGCHVFTHDPVAYADEAKQHFAIELIPWYELPTVDVMIFAVSHQQFIRLSKKEIASKIRKNGLVVDVKGLFKPNSFNHYGLNFWQL
ncbi:MAG: nucleotide sugar dehydrogenase [Gammaproteobacteria bacterium]